MKPVAPVTSTCFILSITLLPQVIPTLEEYYQFYPPVRLFENMLLVTRDGEIVWRTTGPFVDDKRQELIEIVQGSVT
jgi:hypothetical protein